MKRLLARTMLGLLVAAVIVLLMPGYPTTIRTRSGTSNWAVI